jgi:hypothetical protein
MSDRLARTPNAAPTATASGGPEPPQLKHCWVTDRYGHLPGLLLGWRNIAGAWEGRVVHPVLVDDGWQLVEEWLPAGLLDQA